MFFHIRNSLILNKGLMYVNMTLKGKAERVLAFIIPMGQRCLVLNGVYVMPAIRASKGPWLSLKRGSGGP